MPPAGSPTWRWRGSEGSRAFCSSPRSAPRTGAEHKLWDITGLKGEPSSGERTALADALRQVYGVRVRDTAVGRIVEAAGEGALTLVCSLHGGSAPNTSRVEVLPEMLARVLGGGPPAAGTDQPAPSGEGAGTNQWRHAVKCRLPVGI